MVSIHSTRLVYGFVTIAYIRRTVEGCQQSSIQLTKIRTLGFPICCLSEVAITVRVDKELERGCAQGILQIVGEEVQPGKREQQ